PEEVVLCGEPEPGATGARSEQEQQRHQSCDDADRDRRLAADDRQLPGTLGDRCRRRCRARGGHAFTAFVSREALRRAPAPGRGRRNTARTSGGAAMNSTTSGCTTSTLALGTFSAACMLEQPALKPPDRTAAASTPHGLERP